MQVGGRGTLPVLGGVLVLYAMDLTRTAMAEAIPKARIRYFIAMDVPWVVGSVVVL